MCRLSPGQVRGSRPSPRPGGSRKPPEAPGSPLAWLTPRPKQQTPSEQMSTGGWYIFKRSYFVSPLTFFLFHNSHTIVGHPRRQWPTHRASHGEVTSESESGGCRRRAEQSEAGEWWLGKGRKPWPVSDPEGKLYRGVTGPRACHRSPVLRPASPPVLACYREHSDLNL